MSSGNWKFSFGITWWLSIVFFWFIVIASLAYCDHYVRNYKSETVEIKTKEVHCNCVCTEAP